MCAKGVVKCANGKGCGLRRLTAKLSGAGLHQSQKNGRVPGPASAEAQG
jgi:hypothetical protein